jgi:hypothetical protein
VRPGDDPIEWHPEFVDAPDGMEAEPLPGTSPSGSWPLVAHGMTGSITFEGTALRIDIEDHATDRSADRHLVLPIGEVGAVEWVPASNTHRGVIRFVRRSDTPTEPTAVVAPFEQYSLVPPSVDGTAVAFKLRQQRAFEAIHDAVERHLQRRPA